MGKHNIFKTIDKALLGMILFMSVQVQAQNNKDDTLNTKDIVPDRVPSTSLFVELGGKFFPSVNVDYRPQENFAIGIGTSIWHDAEEHPQWLFIPAVTGYYFTGKRHRLEMGGGTGAFPGTYMGLSSILLFGYVGYRYQKKKGLLFRVGFTPFMGIPIAKDARFMAIPWAGISIGYSF
jgi:hypothetical protein